MPISKETLLEKQKNLANELQICHHEGKMAARGTSDPVEESKSYNTPAITGDLRTNNQKIGVGKSNRIIFSTTYLASSQSRHVNQLLKRNRVFIGLNIEKSKISEASRADPFTDEVNNTKGRISYKARFPNLVILKKDKYVGNNNPSIDDLLNIAVPLNENTASRDYSLSEPFHEITLKIFIQSLLCVGITIDSLDSNENSERVIKELIQLQKDYGKILGFVIPIVVYNNQEKQSTFTIFDLTDPLKI